MKFPSELRMIWHSLLCMVMGWFTLSVMSILIGTIATLISRLEWSILVFFIPMWSIIVVLVAWLILFMPVYLYYYYNEKYFSNRWRFTLTGGIVGFLVPFGGMFFCYGMIDHANNYPWNIELLSLAFLGGVTGGTAAETGRRLRKLTLENLNTEYNEH